MSNDFDIPVKSIKSPAVKGAPKAPVEEQVETVTKVEQKGTEPQYDKQELLKIFDDIIFSGEYVEEIMIRGRLPVRFSTRTAEQINKIQDTLDAAGYQLISTVENRRMILTLEQALVGYNGQDLSIMKAPERSKFIGSLSATIIGVLIDEMNKFDMKIAAACREESNF